MESNWLQKETEHYIFKFLPNSLAEKDIDFIARNQEACFRKIADELQIQVTQKIVYWLCESRKQVGEYSGFGESNSFAYCDPQNPYIYAVYSDAKKCIGPHEDAHVVACFHSLPNSAALKEGLAMYFDKTWWGIENDLCVVIYTVDGKYRSIVEMIINDEIFYAIPSEVSYPIMGAFTSFMIQKYGIDKYKEFYIEHESYAGAYKKVYGNELINDEAEFVKSIKLCKFTENQLSGAREILYK